MRGAELSELIHEMMKEKKEILKRLKEIGKNLDTTQESQRMAMLPNNISSEVIDLCEQKKRDGFGDQISEDILNQNFVLSHIRPEFHHLFKRERFLIRDRNEMVPELIIKFRKIHHFLFNVQREVYWTIFEFIERLASKGVQNEKMEADTRDLLMFYAVKVVSKALGLKNSQDSETEFKDEDILKEETLAVLKFLVDKGIYNLFLARGGSRSEKESIDLDFAKRMIKTIFEKWSCSKVVSAFDRKTNENGERIRANYRYRLQPDEYIQTFHGMMYPFKLTKILSELNHVEVLKVWADKELIQDSNQ